MFEKETKNEKYRNNPYRAVNFKKDPEGNIICPNGRRFNFKKEQHIKKMLKMGAILDANVYLCIQRTCQQ